MRRTMMAALLSLAAAMPLAAQAPGAMPPQGGPPMGPAMDGAAFLLAHTGELKLSDAQVTRLAAIARRTQEQREAMHASMMAAHQQMMAQGQGGQPNAAPRQDGHPDFAQHVQQMEQMREQAHAALRDALAVLTADQQATAFEMMAHHPEPRGGPHGGPGRPGADQHDR
jgi:hypothetical protein